MASRPGSTKVLPKESMNVEDMWAAIGEDAEFRRRNVPFDDQSLDNTDVVFVSVRGFERLFGSRSSEFLDQYVRFLVEAFSKRPCPNLQKLHLDGSSESNQTFVNFLESVSWGHLSNLKSVEIRGAAGAEAAECIAKAAEEGHLSKLSSLVFWSARVADGVVALMRAAKSGHLHTLEHLTLKGEDLREERLADLGQAIEAGSLERLQSLRLGFILDDAGAQELARALRSGKVQSLSSLKTGLKGGQAGFTSLAGALEVGSVPSLKQLYLYSRMRMPKGGSEAMARAMLSGHLSQLETLHLQNLEAGETVVHALARGEFASLKSLWLWDCSLGREAANVIASQLKLGRWPCFEHLNLGGNPLGDGGVAALARVLEEGHVHKLSLLCLGGTHMHDEGPIAIGSVFANESIQFPNLELVDLLGNNIGETGVAALVNAYRKNALLTAELKLEWLKGSPWEGNYEGFRKRNLRGLEAAKILRKYEEKVPATLGRVFLCGEPEVGKTTLRRSLESSCSSFGSRFLASAQSLSCIPPGRQAAPEKERTRGIEVSCISNRGPNPLTLSVWDLAGQREYHILHAGFFPEAAFMEVQATVFLVLCRDTGALPTDVESKNLEYWFRFIASSSLRGIDASKRRVLVLRNRHGHSTSSNDDQWNNWVGHFKTHFQEFMKIELYTSSFDVRSHSKAKQFCEKLFSKAGELLSQKEIPKICATLESDLQSWGKRHDQFPIVTAKGVREIVRKWNSSPSSFIPSSEKERMVIANAALKFLNQVGTLIFFPEGSLLDGGMGQSSLAVVDPGWFCRRVVGDLLLPESLWHKGQEKLVRKELKMNADNSWTISIDDLRAVYHTKGVKLDDVQMKQIVSILLHVGLCFKVDASRVFIPALAPEETSPPRWCTEEYRVANERQWVMGLSLMHVDANKTLLPASLFYKFQVLLVQDPAIRNRTGADFHAGQNFVAFRAMQMIVPIEFRTDEKISHTDRIDVMVKPALHKSDIHQQVNFADELVRKLEEVRRSCCPGVQLEARIIKPWSVCEAHPSMQVRNVSQTPKNILDGLLASKVECGPEWKDTSRLEWYVRGEEVKREDLLTADELSIWARQLFDRRNEERRKIESAENVLSLLSARTQKEATQGTSTGEILTRASSKVGPVTLHRENSKAGLSEMEKRFDALENRVDKRFDTLENRVETLEHQMSEVLTDLSEVKTDLRELFTDRRKLWLQIHCLEAVSSAERENSIPRYVYCKARESGGKWMDRFTEAFKTSSTLHFLCEYRYDNHSLHEVEGQEGYDVTHMPHWLHKNVSWLKWSLCIASVGVSLGAVVIPGLNVVAPTVVGGVLQVAQTGVGEIESRTNAMGDLRLASTSADAPIEVTGPSRKALQELFGSMELTRDLIQEKFKLTMVLLDEKVSEKSGRVLWVCDKCSQKGRFIKIGSHVSMQHS